ncbi:hypothetical protein GC173_18035 [bacterium]|nr:hypothetical protein [bacterium]
MAINSFAVFANETSIALSPEQIERELSSMWKPINEAQGTSVSRVVLGNVLWLGCASRIEHVRGVFQRVIPKYPARIFLLDYQPDNTSPEMVAAVNAQCFLPAPGAAPVCCEVIHLAFGPASARHVRGAVAPLLVPDVQTVLWTGLGAIPFPELEALQQHVDRTIRMASLTDNPVQHFRSTLETTHPTIDLSWFRTTPLREQVTAFFDDPQAGFDLTQVRGVELGGPTGAALPVVVAAMFIGWLGARLSWQVAENIGDHLTIASPSGLITVFPWFCPKVQDERVIRLTDSNGATFEVQLGPDGMTLRCCTPGRAVLERHLRLHELSEDEALGLALNTPSKARHFREAVVMAIPILDFIKRTERNA